MIGKEKNEYYQNKLKNLLIKMKEYESVSRVFIFTSSDFTYGWIEMKDGNILHVSRSLLSSLGWNISFDWKPSRENGDGWLCTKHPLEIISEDDLRNAVTQGLFASLKYNTIRYNNFEEYKKSHWASDKIIEL